jgi:hypothetical protein
LGLGKRILKLVASEASERDERSEEHLARGRVVAKPR